MRSGHTLLDGVQVVTLILALTLDILELFAPDSQGRWSKRRFLATNYYKFYRRRSAKLACLFTCCFVHEVHNIHLNKGLPQDQPPCWRCSNSQEQRSHVYTMERSGIQQTLERTLAKKLRVSAAFQGKTVVAYHTYCTTMINANSYSTKTIRVELTRYNKLGATLRATFEGLAVSALKWGSCVKGSMPLGRRKSHSQSPDI